MIFSEKLPPLWWVGAAGLVVGNVVIGRREEGDGDEDGKSKQQAAKGVRLEGDDGPVGEGYRDLREGRARRWMVMSWNWIRMWKMRRGELAPGEVWEMRGGERDFMLGY